MANQGKFDIVTLRAPKDGSDVNGDFYGLPWPCAGASPRSSIRARTSSTTRTCTRRKAAARSARALASFAKRRTPTARPVRSACSDGSYSAGSELTDGYPEFTLGVLKKLGWDKDLTAAELEQINAIGGNNPDSVGWAIDLSGGIIRVALDHGCIPFGNGKARAVAYNLPDPVPVHREPIYSPRPDLVAKYPTRPTAASSAWRTSATRSRSVRSTWRVASQFPIIPTPGRLVEYEGGGEETRSNKWLAELQQDMFVEINPADAGERGIKDGHSTSGCRDRRRERRRA